MLRIIVNLNELEQFANKISKELPENVIFLLEGDLASGKTTFSKFLVKALNVKDLVVSPSFVIMNQYSQDNILVNHFDFYRLLRSKNVQEEINEFNNYFGQGINIIEWPILPPSYYANFCHDIIRIEFHILNTNTRELKIFTTKG